MQSFGRQGPKAATGQMFMLTIRPPDFLGLRHMRRLGYKSSAICNEELIMYIRSPEPKPPVVPSPAAI